LSGLFVAEVGAPSEVGIIGEDVVVEDEVFVGTPSEVGITDVDVERAGSVIGGVLS
jgi:hypothetical protein